MKINMKKVLGNALGAFLIALPASSVIIGITPVDKAIFAFTNALIAAGLSALMQIKEQLDSEGNASSVKINTWLMF